MSEVQAVGREGAISPVGTYQATAAETRPAQDQNAAKQKLSPAQIDGVVKELNEAMKLINTSISFSVDKPTGKTVIKVMDSDTKKVIRQIPSEEMMRVAERITQLLGVLFDKTR